MRGQCHAAFACVPFTRPKPLLIASHTSSFSNRCITPSRPHHLALDAHPSSSSIHATAAPVAATSTAEERWSPTTHSLYLYNTMTKSKQLFTTLEPGLVRFYSCGPTVYDFAHIGNFRAFLTYDLIKRWLMYRGYHVHHVMNLTDVDDKIIKKVNQLDCSAEEITSKYASAFFSDLDLLNVIKAQHYPRATQHIQEIEHVVHTLKQRGFAYQRDGSTYFAVSKFPQYGRLAELDKRQPGSLTAADAAGANDTDEYEKEDLRDFALWKSHKPEDGDVYWNTALGKGRPGWHIECSCMAMKYLGPELDIHAGGIDLVFPHHENEIAQSEALTGKPFARFWIHNGFVNIGNEKMSKSLGNFRTLRDIIKSSDDARAFRYLVVSSQYRSGLAFTETCMKSARSTVKRLDALRNKLEETSDGGDDNVGDHDEEVAQVIANAQADFCHAMDDDLNTPRAAAAMFSVVKFSEKMLKAQKMRQNAARDVLECLNDMNRVFGIFYTADIGHDSDYAAPADDAEPPAELQELLNQRAEARNKKDFAQADKIRDAITSAGYSILDTPQGTKLQRL